MLVRQIDTLPPMFFSPSLRQEDYYWIRDRRLPLCENISTRRVTSGLDGKLGAGCSLNIGYVLFLLAGGVFDMTTDCIRASLLSLLARTSGISSEILFESVKSLASSMSRRDMAMPLLGPRYRTDSSPALRRTKPPRRTSSSRLWEKSPSSSVKVLSSASS